jgi:hypothetical protein
MRTTHGNRIRCYSVKVESPTEIGRPVTAYYLVRSASQTAAISAVEAALTGSWQAVEATLTAVRHETVEALDLRPNLPRRI